MSKRRSLHSVLALAQEKEKEFDWSNAAELYHNAFNRSLKNDLLGACEIGEQIGYCHYRAAFQAHTREEFKRILQQAYATYNNLAELAEKGEHPLRSEYFRALAKCMSHWIAPSMQKKKALLDECIELLKNYTENHEKTDDRLRYGKACSDLTRCLLDKFEIEQNWTNRKSLLADGLNHSLKAVAIFSDLGNDYELARAFDLTSFACFLTGHYGEPKERRSTKLEKCLAFGEKSLQVSQKTGNSYSIGMSNQAVIPGLFWFKGNLKSSFECARRILKCGEETRDNFIIGQGLIWLAQVTYWMMMQQEAPDRKRKGCEKGLEYVNRAASLLSIFSPNAFSGESIWIKLEIYNSLARNEVKPEEKHALFEEVVDTGKRTLQDVRSCQNPETTAWTLHALAKALFYLSQMETESQNKKELLTEASKLREEDVEIADSAFPNWYWYRGVSHNYQALILAELSQVENDLGKKKELLEKAITHTEECVELCEKWTTIYPQTMLLVPLATYYDWFGIILNQLYSLTGEAQNLHRTIMVYRKAIETYAKTGMYSRLAEAYWKTAAVHDRLGEYAASSENFELASENYKLVSTKIRQLKDFYSDYATYMHAWSEVAKAKQNHTEKQYGKAREHYQKAASLCKSTDKWKYLSPNFTAWTRLEEAEDLSRKERPEEAKDLFKKTSDLFEDAKKSLNTQLERIESKDEKEMSTELMNSINTRQEYCTSRILLEEARIFNRQANHLASAKKYAASAEILQNLASDKGAQDLQELESMTYLSSAWEKMMIAEAKASSSLYKEAAGLFEKAKEHATDEQTSLLALANSNLCKALEAGIRFETSKDMAMYSNAKIHMVNASNCYVKAGFDETAAWVNATQNLFDAYVHIGNAESVGDPEAKSRFYNIAEKYLELSADLYRKAHYVGKRDEVLKMLDLVRQKREFAISIAEMLETPSMTSSTRLITAPVYPHELAAGLEIFDGANVQAKLSAPPEVSVGEEFEAKLDLVNVAKSFALLVRVDEMAPLGFKASKVPSQYALENGSLYMKGKKLESLKAEPIKISVEATQPGTFELCPKVVYTDEVGKFRTCRSQPLRLTVHPPLTFKFSTEAAGLVFDSLIRAFTEDYMKRRFVVQEAGWRSLVQVVKHAKVSLRSLYGREGRLGFAISELQRRGLIETRIFLGERGRGGKILRARICYEKETIKRYVDNKVSRSG